MNLWEKIQNELHKGAEKTGEMVKEGAELASNRVAYTSKLAQLNWEERTLKSSINNETTELGELLYKLNESKKLENLANEAKPHFEKLAGFETELKNKEQEKNDLAKTYGIESIDKGIVKELRHDLEEGGGTIMQVVVSDTSPFLNKKLKEVVLPKEALIGTIIRNEKVVIPDGETVFNEGDKVTILGKRDDVERAILEITK